MSVYVCTPVGEKDVEYYGVVVGDDLEQMQEVFDDYVQDQSEVDEAGEPVNFMVNPGGWFLVEVPTDLSVKEFEALFDDPVQMNFELWKALPEWNTYLYASDFPLAYFDEIDEYFETETLPEPRPEVAGAKVVAHWQAFDLSNPDEAVDYATIFAEQGGEVDFIEDLDEVSYIDDDSEII